MLGESFLMFSTVVVKKLYLIYSSVGDIKFSFPSFNELEIIFYHYFNKNSSNT